MTRKPASANQPGGAGRRFGLTPERVRSLRQTARRLLRRGLFLLGGFSFLLVLTTGFAGWYTSRPQFCNTCHYMEPYYKSWQTSVHGKKNVSCIDCHFPPGIGGKVRGKMLGLVQLAKYMTASAGPRPWAEVPDASCLRSGCHETRLLAGRVTYRNRLPDGREISLPFDHAPHLTGKRRGIELRCTSCHSRIVQGGQGEHMTVTASTCFLCHFKGQGFGEGLSRCTHCHQIPTKEFHLSGGVTFTHDLAYQHGAKCVNCHGDVIRGAGSVPRRNCVSCHNREGDLARINDPAFIHSKHVEDHKVDCVLCHEEIEHSLDMRKIEHAAGDCTSCHPNHHRQQVDMLRGRGAETMPADERGMATIRIECKTCHQEEKFSATGDIFRVGSWKMCLSCHDPAAVTRFQGYHEELRASLPEIAAALSRVGDAVQKSKLPSVQATKVAEQLAALRHDLAFLRAANDVHNMHYAAKLNRSLLERMSSLCREWKVAAPKATVAVPPPVKPSR